MSNLTIYLSGVIIALTMGLIALTFTKDKECNIEIPECVGIVLLCMTLSWFMVVVFVSLEIRTRYVVKEEK